VTIVLAIEEMKPEDWESVSRIYREGIETGNATFETSVPPYEELLSAHMPGYSLVARSGGAVAGWAALSPASKRYVYRGVAEVSIYVGEGYRGMGVGSTLMEALIKLAESGGIWTLQGGTFPENKASLALQEKYGFRVVGTREKLGKMDGNWRDVVLTERRSDKAGID
jgi:L-amino acid N-acyltransferase YncA